MARDGTRLAAMAWRNIWRNRRRTLITLSSIGFGTMLAFIMTAVQDAQWRDMIDVAARLGGGHVTLQHSEYLDTPTLSRSIRNTPGLRALALEDPHVDRVVERITGFLMLSTAGQSYGAAFIAYDPAAEDPETLSILEAVKEGELLEDAHEPRILVGSQLARNLKTRLGKKIIFTLTDKNAEIISESVRLKGIIHTGAPTLDGALVLLPIGLVRKTIAYAPDEAVQLGLFLEDQRQAKLVAARLGGNLEAGVDAVPWYDAQADLATFIMMKIAGSYFFEAVMALLIAAGIFNTIFVSVMERLREFGVLLAIGFSPRRLFGLVMFESFWLGAVGLLFAALLTAWPYYFLATTGIDMSAMIGEGSAEVAGVAIAPIIKAGIYPENFVYISLAALGATLLSGLYPAWKAGRIEPVESIRLV
jgi:ABC-type lipoprotein release transport system permease subunit